MWCSNTCLLGGSLTYDIYRTNVLNQGQKNKVRFGYIHFVFVKVSIVILSS
jgi:hypothetical protein